MTSSDAALEQSMWAQNLKKHAEETSHDLCRACMIPASFLIVVLRDPGVVCAGKGCKASFEGSRLVVAPWFSRTISNKLGQNKPEIAWQK